MNPTNQASPEFSVVPVLPAANSPKAARRPGALTDHGAMICAAVAATAAGSTGCARGSFSSTTLLAVERAHGTDADRAVLRGAERAGDAPAAGGEGLVGVRHVERRDALRRPPSVIAGLVETGVRMPIRSAVRSRPLRVPTWMPAAA